LVFTPFQILSLLTEDIELGNQAFGRGFGPISSGDCCERLTHHWQIVEPSRGMLELLHLKEDVTGKRWHWVEDLLLVFTCSDQNISKLASPKKIESELQTYTKNGGILEKSAS
jgi:hypothetical protein